MKINEIFEKLVKIEPKVVSIETLFNNQETLKNTKYDPDYQRNYVWDDDKATYFIESILLGTEIPPIIYFRNDDKIEIIDGRQRYETILRFIKDEFKLKISGLQKLDRIGISGKFFKDIGELKDDFWDTKLRIIEFSFHTRSLSIEDDMSIEDMEDIVKKEVFKRYNSGITPLKSIEIDKAFYFDNNLNKFIQNKLEEDKVIFRELQDIFFLEKSNKEILLKKIRQLLVQHKIPIKYYAVKKDSVIAKYYELLSSKIEEDDDIEEVFSNFLTKINILKRIKKQSTKNKLFYNRLVSECLFWALAIIDENTNRVNEIDELFIESLSNYINEKKDIFDMNRSSFAKELQNRYSITAKFFSNKFDISFEDYLVTSSEFKNKNKEKNKHNSNIEETSFDDLRINKPEPSSITIVDIFRQMDRQRFLIRPPYQRSEVKNRNKSSAIIESILLGIKLPPIFVYKRKDGVSEVLDGQQRLLSILGFLRKEYLDEKNEKQKSNKDGYSLSLKTGILTDLDKKNVDDLTPEQVKKINNFDLWIIEINHRYNKDFEPIDLFLRLNSKPYPIKENTFEMWNSYINKEIVNKVKEIYNQHSTWFYFRKNNKRMENENIYTSLAYLQYFDNFEDKKSSRREPLEYYKIGTRINFRISLKTEITKVLENPKEKDNFLKACKGLSEFITKVKVLVQGNNLEDEEELIQNIDSIFNVSQGRRTQQSFYALWYFISKVSIGSISSNKKQIRDDLKELFLVMKEIENKDDFTKKIEEFWKRYGDK